MSIFKKFLHSIASAGHAIQGWFVKHGPDIHNAISEAQGAIHVATSVTAVVAAGNPDHAGESSRIITALGKVDAGLKLASDLVDHEASSETLTDQVKAITAVASDLNDVGVVNENTKAAIAAVTTKVNAVTETLTQAASAAAAGE